MIDFNRRTPCRSNVLQPVIHYNTNLHPPKAVITRPSPERGRVTRYTRPSVPCPVNPKTENYTTFKLRAEIYPVREVTDSVILREGRISCLHGPHCLDFNHTW